MVPEEQTQLYIERGMPTRRWRWRDEVEQVEFIMQTLIEAYQYQFASFPGPHHFRLHDHEEPFLRAAENGTGVGTRIGTSIRCSTLPLFGVTIAMVMLWVAIYMYYNYSPSFP